MSEKKPKKPPKIEVKEDDPRQSEAFRKAVSDLEADGELNDTEANEVFERVLSPAKLRQKQEP